MRDFFKTGADIAGGELQGRIEGQQHAEAMALQALQQGQQVFQQGHQLEQEQRQQQLGPLQEALRYGEKVIPEQRGGFYTNVLGAIGKITNAPLNYGQPQLQQLYQQYQRAVPSAVPFPFPTPQAGAAPGTTPGPAPGTATTAPPAAPPSPPPGTEVPGGGQPVAAAGGPLASPPAAPGPPGGFGPLVGPFLGGGGQQAPAAPLSPGDQMGQMLNQQFGGVMGQLPLTAQDALHAFAGPQFQAAQAHRQAVTAHAAATSGASGTNPAGTAPPNRPPAEAQIGAGSGGQQAAAPPPGPSAPPPPVPSSATVGVAPRTVGLPPGVLQGALGPGVPNAPKNVLRIPGVPGEYAYGEIDPKTAQAAETRLATAYSRLINAHLSPDQRKLVQDLAAARPAQINTAQDLAALNSLTSQLEAMPAGLGSSIYSAEERAKNSTPEEAKLVQQALAIIGKGGRRLENGLVDPEYVRQVVSQIGGGKISYLADIMASGDFGTGDVQKLLNKSIDNIFKPGFAHLDAGTRRKYLDMAQGWADTLGQKVDLPADAYLELTPAERARVEQGWARVRTGENNEADRRAQLQLQRDRLEAQKQGLIGQRGKTGSLTANVTLAAARLPYKEALDIYKGLRTKNDYYANVYDTAKNRAMMPRPDYKGVSEHEAIQRIINDPATTDEVARNIAFADLRRLEALQHFQSVERELATQGLPAAQGGGGTAGVRLGGPGGPVYPIQPTAPGAALNHGVPGPGQGQPQAMIFTSPTGEKRRVVKDPAQVASYLLGQHPGWTAQQAQRQVQMMIQEAKAGRSR